MWRYVGSEVLTVCLSLPDSKLVTLVVSIFSAAYVALWPQYFPNSPLTLEELPVFDGRCVVLPRGDVLSLS